VTLVTRRRAVLGLAACGAAAGALWLGWGRPRPAGDELSTLRARLKERNPDLDEGQVDARLEAGRVVELELPLDAVRDLSPLSDLKRLRKLGGAGPSWQKGALTDLGPLRGLPLTHLRLQHTPLKDLRPLAELPLVDLDLTATAVSDLRPLGRLRLERLVLNSAPVADLAPLRGMPLRELDCGTYVVADLRPLEGLPLERLNVYGTSVWDLSPLRQSKLTWLNCGNCRNLQDLSPLAAAPLRELRCDPRLAWRNAAVLRAMPALRSINGGPVAVALRGK
jgi:hypothetical protein